MTRELSFDDLRAANIARLPQFRNAHGAPAHAQKDGSDWDRAAWLEAMVGEVGEYANYSKKFRRGDIDYVTFLMHARKELADVQIYLDLLAFNLGLSLGVIVEMKFNEVSERVGSNIFLYRQLGACARVIQDSSWNHVPLVKIE